MNSQSKEVILASMSVAERAANALSREETEAEILALVGKSKPIVAVTDNASREVCHTSLMELVDLRVLISKRGKAGREEANQYSKAVIAIEKDLIALLTPEEQRLAKLRDDFDAAKKAAKEAEIQKELLRQKSHRENVAELQNWCLVLTPSSGSECISEWMLDLESLVVDDSYEEFQEQAEGAKAASMARLTALRDAALAHEEAQRKLESDRAELAKLKAEETERQRIAAEERAKQEAIVKAEREAEAKKEAEVRDVEQRRLAAERLKNEREAAERKAELDRLEAEVKAARDAEEARLEAERQANAAEAARLAAEREVLAREAEELRKSQEPVPEVLARQESALPAPLQAVPDLKEIPQDQGTSLDEPLDALQLAVLLGRARYYVNVFEPRTEEEEEAQSQLLSEIDEMLPGESVTITGGKAEDWDDGLELPF